MSLSEEQIRAYEEDGFLSGLRVFGAEEAAEVRRAFDDLERDEGRETARIGLIDRHFDSEFVWRLATHPTILEAMDAFVGPDILLLATHFFCKYGRDGRFVAWHQDVTYWGLEPPVALTAWLAIDDSTVENGCMRVLPGSHRRGLLRHGKSGEAGNLLSVNQEIAVGDAEAARAVDIELRAGEMSIHDGSLVHGSRPNRSGRRRCGLTIRFVPAHVRQIERNSMKRNWTPVLVRGEDRYGHFEKRPHPFPIRGGVD